MKKDISTKIKEEISIFCKNIKNLREKEKLSKKDMAKLLGISVHSLTMIENGTIPKRLSCRILIKIYDEFGILSKDIFKPL